MIRKKNQFSKVYIEEDPNYTNMYFQKEIYQNINHYLWVMTLWINLFLIYII